MFFHIAFLVKLEPKYKVREKLNKRVDILQSENIGEKLDNEILNKLNRDLPNLLSLEATPVLRYEEDNWSN